MSENMENNNLTIGTSQVPPASDASTSGTTSSGKKFNCDVCGISVSSSRNFAAHVKGRKHFRKANPGMIFPKKVLPKDKEKKSVNDKTILTSKGNNLENIKENTMSKSETKKQSKSEAKNKKVIKTSPNLKKNNSDRHYNNRSKNHSSREEFNTRAKRYNSNSRNKWNHYRSRHNYNDYSQNLHSNYDNNYRNYNRKNNNHNTWNDQNPYDSWNNKTNSYSEKYDGKYSQQDVHPECNETNNSNNLPKHKLYNDENLRTKNAKEKNCNMISPDSTNFENRETNLVDSTMSSDKDNINLKGFHNSERPRNKTTDRYFSHNNRTIVSSLNLTSEKGLKESDTTLNNSANYSIESEQQTENVSLPEGARQQDKRMFSENMSGRIAHWINPLNSRDKFEVKKLMTEFSKSRKKENLLKLKQHAENESLNDEEDAIKNSMAKRLDELQNKSNSNSESAQRNCKINDSGELSSTKETVLGTYSSSQNVPISPKPRKRKKSSLSESNVNLYAANMGSDLLLSTFNSLNESNNVPKNLINEVSKKGSQNKMKSHSSIDLPILSPRQELNNIQLNIETEDIFSKRKNSFSQTNKSKKHRCSSFECLEKCIQETARNSPSAMVPAELQMPSALDENLQREIYSELYQSSPVIVKQEISRSLTQNEIDDNNLNNATNEQEMFNTITENAEILNVEDLMKVFAVKHVTIKKEFDDPLIDAIKNMNMETLLNINDQSTTVSTKVSSLQHPTVDNSNISQKDNISDSLLPANCNKAAQNNDDSKKIFNESSPYNVYLKISNELKKLQKEEEDKRAALKEIDKELDKYNKIVNELIAKKVKLQTEEENLITRRNGLTCALSHCLIQEPYKSGSLPENETSLPIISNEKATNSSEASNALIELVSKLSDVTDVGTLFSDNAHSMPTKETNTESVSSLSTDVNSVDSRNSLSFSSKPIKNTKVQAVEDNDEITVISEAEQTKNSDIPVIDLVGSDSPFKSTSEISVVKRKGNSSTKCDKSFYDMKTLTVHQTVVNALKVFNDCLYTCSNDYTARRFNLEDPNQIVTYRHSKRNVVQLCIEKFSDYYSSPLVFTLCSSDMIISAFNAKDGTLVKTYYFDFPVASICSSKEKVFAGLKNGLILTCNLKDSKELATNLEPIKSIASTLQGALHVLVVLSTNGQVSVRDVERYGLLIRYIQAPSSTLFMNVNNNYVYLSSLALLTASDISSGTEEHKIKLTSPITGLAAYEHNVFTTSFSGLVRCYPNGKAQEVKVVYGAGNSALTSICISQGWIFTGNRNGEVAVFQFEPETNYSCQFGNCRHVFIRVEDIERHVLLGVDHILPKKSLKCPWRECKFYFKADWKEEAKKTHLKEHLDTLIAAHKNRINTEL